MKRRGTSWCRYLNIVYCLLSVVAVVPGSSEDGGDDFAVETFVGFYFPIRIERLAWVGVRVWCCGGGGRLPR